MKKLYLIPLTATLLAAPGLALAGARISPQDDVVAMVNNEPITREMLVKRVLAYYGSANLEAMVNQTLVRQAAERENITVSEKEIDDRVGQLKSMMRTPEMFGQWLHDSGLTEQHYRDQVRYTLLTEKLVLKQHPISDSDFERIRARILLVQTEPEAREILQQLKQGADFIQLAREKSIDKDTAEAGGLLPDFLRVDYPEMWQALAGVKPGELSKPVKLGANFAILKLEERLPASTLEAPQRERDRQRLLNYRMNAWLDGVRKQAKISYPVPVNLP